MVRSSNLSSSSRASLLIGAALAIAALYFGRQIFMPLALAVVLTFLFTPVVGLFEKARLGRVLSVLIVMTLCFALVAGLGWLVAGQLLDITGHLRDYKSNLEETLQSLRSPRGVLGQAAQTVRDLNKELSTVPGPNPQDANGHARPARPVPVQVTTPSSNIFQQLHTLLGPLAGVAETTVIVIVFTGFMLIKREDLRNRLIRLGGQERLTVVTQALDDASRRLSRYLLMQFLVNSTYGVCFGIGLHFLAVPHALLWGALAGLLRFVPYVGTLIAAAFPVGMALVVLPGWQHALMVFGLFLVLEAIVVNIVEPWLYGAHTGMSSFAILVAAVFWSLLWGPVGLILSTPLTVCLLLAGRYVPQLNFLEVMLGDEPVLGAHELFYQRLLATDQDEARNIVESELREKSLEGLYETVLIPALRLAEEDRHMDALGERASEFISQSTRELIEDLGERTGLQSLTKPVNGDRGKGDRDFRIVCVPARDEADELVAVMFAQVLQRAGYEATWLARATVADLVGQVEHGHYRIACVSALPPFAVGQARGLCRRLQARFPEMVVMVGLWEFAGGVPKAEQRVGTGCARAVVTTLSEGLLEIRKLSTPVPPEASEAKAGEIASRTDAEKPPAIDAPPPDLKRAS